MVLLINNNGFERKCKQYLTKLTDSICNKCDALKCENFDYHIKMDQKFQPLLKQQ